MYLCHLTLANIFTIQFNIQRISTSTIVLQYSQYSYYIILWNFEADSVMLLAYSRILLQCFQATLYIARSSVLLYTEKYLRFKLLTHYKFL